MTLTRRYDSLLAELQQRPRRSTSFLVAVDGCAGSGKTTFSRKLSQLNPSIEVVHIDDFYRPSEERPANSQEIAANFDLERLSAQVLAPLLHDQIAQYQRYDWGEDRLAENHTISVGNIVIIEGVYTLLPRLVDTYDYTVWVECPYDLRLARGLARDGEKARSWWVDDWMPAEQCYIKQYSPAAHVELKVDGSVEMPDEFAVLTV